MFKFSREQGQHDEKNPNERHGTREKKTINNLYNGRSCLIYKYTRTFRNQKEKLSNKNTRQNQRVNDYKERKCNEYKQI